MSHQKEQGDWIFASVINFLESPLWSTPIMTFVDQHCIVFDSEDENKLEFTQIHTEFKDLVENLLDRYILQEVNITMEQFFDACQQEANSLHAKILFDQVLAAEDFLAFKRMMYARNVLLEAEAIAALREAEKRRAEAAKKAKEEEEAAQVTEAVRLSSEEDKARAQARAEEELAFQRAIENSKTDTSARINRDELARKEQDDLDEAIAASLIQEKVSKGRTAAFNAKHEEWVRSREAKEKEKRQAVAEGALGRLFERKTQEESPEIDEEAIEARDALISRQHQIRQQRDLICKENTRERTAMLQEYLAI